MKSAQEFLPRVLDILGANRESWILAEKLDSQLSGLGAHVAALRKNVLFIEAESTGTLSDLSLRKREVEKWVRALWVDNVPEVRIFLKGMLRPKKKDLIETLKETALKKPKTEQESRQKTAFYPQRKRRRSGPYFKKSAV